MTEIARFAQKNEHVEIAFDDGRLNIMSPAMLRQLHQAFDRAEREKTGDLGRREWGYLIPITAGIVLLGVVPNVVLSKTEKPVTEIVQVLMRTRLASAWPTI